VHELRDALLVQSTNAQLRVVHVLRLWRQSKQLPDTTRLSNRVRDVRRQCVRARAHRRITFLQRRLYAFRASRIGTRRARTLRARPQTVNRFRLGGPRVRQTTNVTTTASATAVVPYSVCACRLHLWTPPQPSAYTCSLSSDAGRQCTTAVSRWYFDTINQRCSTFLYYGCDGNPNNFATASSCETYCGVGGWARTHYRHII
jgi:hypothetical protein